MSDKIGSAEGFANLTRELKDPLWIRDICITHINFLHKVKREKHHP